MTDKILDERVALLYGVATAILSDAHVEWVGIHNRQDDSFNLRISFRSETDTTTTKLFNQYLKAAMDKYKSDFTQKEMEIIKVDPQAHICTEKIDGCTILKPWEDSECHYRYSLEAMISILIDLYAENGYTPAPLIRLMELNKKKRDDDRRYRIQMLEYSLTVLTDDKELEATKQELEMHYKELNEVPK